MFCIECGEQLIPRAKFCSNCGTKVIHEQDITAEDPQTNSTDDAVAVGQDPDKEAIIASADTTRMAERARAALKNNNIPDADFWYLEWITADGAPHSVLAEGILAYCSELLTPSKRFSEAELYLAWLSHSSDSDIANLASARMQEVHRSRGAYGMKRFRPSKDWKAIDVSLALDPSWPAEKQYLRAIAWLDAVAANQERAPFGDRSNPQHLPYVTGFVVGMKESITAIGADWEASIQGLQDWIDVEVSEQERIRDREKTAQLNKSRPKPETPRPSRPQAPTTNSLGDHIDDLFGDKKMAEQIKSALSCSSGVNNDFVVAYFPVANELGDGGEFYEHYMIFTKEKVAIVKKSGMFSTGARETISKNNVAFVGIGESNHYEAQGLSGRSTEWISFTLELRDGRRFTRHFYLGHSESEVNSNIPVIRDGLGRMRNVGWIIDDGPAWNSSGGYRTSYGYGIGFWR